MILLILILIPAALVISAVLCRVLIVWARRVGLMDRPGQEGHKAHAAPVPNIGGMAIFAALAAPLAAGLAVIWLMPQAWWSGRLAPLAEHLPGLREQTPAALAILIGLIIFHVMGVIDDRRRLGPWTKLIIQGAVSLTLAWGFGVRVLQLFDAWGPAGFALSLFVSVFWIVLIVNAMNMLDNMDGLSAGVGAIITSLYLAATLIGQQWFIAALAALLLGALLGFLLFNFPPAKLFMGDGGSMVLGLMLGVISIRTTYFDTTGTLHQPGAWYGILMPLMVMAVPLYDLVSVTLVRLSRGLHPFHADQNHFSHRLVRRGLTRRRAVLVIWLCTLATGLAGVMLSTLTGWQAVVAAGQTAAVLALLAILEREQPTGHQGNRM